jgi:hypothetical protein
MLIVAYNQILLENQPKIVKKKKKIIKIEKPVKKPIKQKIIGRGAIVKPTPD